MNSLETDSHGFIRYLITNIKCAVCGEYYQREDVRVVGHQEGLWAMTVACGSCHTQGLVFAMVKEGEAPEVISEPTPSEWAAFEVMPQISTDDVLEVHNLLRDFEGDFSDLLGKGQAPPD